MGASTQKAVLEVKGHANLVLPYRDNYDEYVRAVLLAQQAVLRDTCAAGAHDQRRPRTQPRAFSLR